MSKKIFSGVQPTGNLHLGNYLGAIKNFVNFQNQNNTDCIYCVVDLHAITVKQDPVRLKANIRETTAAFIASGLDHKKSIIFQQSMVAAHSEFSWILGCSARMGWLNRMTQFKEKAGKDKEKASVGLYVYPVLMAADILLYDTTHVPVGEDQKQHLELTRDIAQKFNLDFNSNDFLKIPEPMIQKEFARIMSLKDGTKKMSKSDPSEMSRIILNDTKEEIEILDQITKSDLKEFCIPLNNLNISKIIPIIKNCNVAICNDSSFSHLSAALNIPTIVLMADTPLVYGSYSSLMHPILPEGAKTVSHDTLGKDKINPSEVQKKLDEILSNIF